MGEWSEKTKKFIKQNYGYFIVVIACAIYTARGLITIDKTGKTVYEIIVDGALAFFFGVFISRMLDLQGLTNGERDERVIKTNTLHQNIVDEITPYIDELDDWCDQKNAEALKNARIRILKSEGMKYEDYFDENATPKEYTIDFDKYYYKSKLFRKKDRKKIYERARERAKFKAYKKACNLKLTLLTVNSLTNDGGKEYDPYYLGRSKKRYERDTSTREVFSKIVVGIITGIYGIKMITDFSWQSMIWTGIQVVLFLLMGGVKMFQSMFFITDEHRCMTIKKIDKLQIFKAEHEQLSKKSQNTVAIEQKMPENVEIKPEIPQEQPQQEVQINQVEPEIISQGENTSESKLL